jgi:high affinity sulfate transporter 1
MGQEREAAPADAAGRSWLPGLRLLRTYRRAWLARDAAAGLALATLLVPTGMAYAEAAGLPPEAGLYATLLPLIAYAVFGPSRVLILGPDSSLAPLIAAAVLPLAGGDAARSLALAGALAVLTGLLCVAAGVLRFGFLAELLSKPVRYGYLNGIALTVIVGQLPTLCGFSVDATGLVPEARAFVDGLRDGRTNGAALALGAGCLAVILGCRRWAPRAPGALLAVAGATAVVAVLDLAARAGVPVVGELPRGLPGFRLPAVSAGDVGPLVAGAAGIALVSFADTSVLSRALARRGRDKGRDEVDPSQELVALGAADAAAGLFGGFPVSASASRTPAALAAGAQSQVTGLVGAAAIALLLVFLPGLFRDLPAAALGAVVIGAALGLAEVAGVRRLYRLRRREFALSLACFLGVALFGVLPGVFLAVGLALADVVRRAWRPYDAVLGRVDGLKGYHDVARHPEARRVPGLVLFRWDAPLFFANAEVFQDRVRRAVAESPTPARWVVVAAEPVTDVDTTAADALAELNAELAGAGVTLAFAEMKGPVKDELKRYGLFADVGEHRFFPTIGTAVHQYVAEAGVPWVDWEDAQDAARLDRERPAAASVPPERPAGG